MPLQEIEGLPATDEDGGAEGVDVEGRQLFAGSPRGMEDEEGMGGAIGPGLWITEVGEL